MCAVCIDNWCTMAAHNVFGYLMDAEVEEYAWHIYHKMQKAIADEGLVLLDKMSFRDFVNICYKFTDGPPRYVHEEEDDEEEYEEISPVMQRLASTAESECG